uniref:Uncharacterized protein n=1 Tax=Parascaris univalens TaxID=6257 RepID=A0A915BAM0_PARUN
MHRRCKKASFLAVQLVSTKALLANTSKRYANRHSAGSVCSNAGRQHRRIPSS